MPTIHRVALESRDSIGQEVVNTFHLRIEEGTPFISVSAAELLDLLEDQLVPHYTGLLNADTTLERIRLATEKDPLDPNDVSVGAVRELGLTGGGGTPAQFCPRELCLAMSLRSSSLGRSFRGHMLLPPIRNAEDIDGELIDANATYLGFAFGLRDVIREMRDGGQFFTPFDEFNARLVVYSRTRRAHGLTPFSVDVDSVVVTRRLHWLRSRAS